MIGLSVKGVVVYLFYIKACYLKKKLWIEVNFELLKHFGNDPKILVILTILLSLLTSLSSAIKLSRNQDGFFYFENC
jgi:hypothetical protein